MEEKVEGMIISEVTLEGGEAPKGSAMEPRNENPSLVSGAIVVAAGAVPPATQVGGAQPATEVKKKRGRPRKYRPDGSVTMALSPMPISASIPLTGDFSAWKQNSVRPVESFKKKHKLEFANHGDRVAYTIGSDFTPHMITVAAGMDVSMKIMSFAQQGSRAICVLSANGTISNVTLRQPSSSGGTLTYEGRFEILSLTGSFTPSDDGVTKSRSGGMSVSLAGPDGRVLGGGLAGMLVAAGPVQVVIGSFPTSHQLEQKPKKQRYELASSFTTIPANPIPEERTEGANYGSKPQMSSSPFPRDNTTSINFGQGPRISSPENNNISFAAPEST